jgi:hypothetical protein
MNYLLKIKINISFFFKELRKIDSIELTEAFILKHGENIVDRVGAEIDRIERNLRVKINYLFSIKFYFKMKFCFF